MNAKRSNVVPIRPPADDVAQAHEPKTKAEQIDALYRHYREDVYRLALRYGRGDRAWAEDVTQDVFLEALRVIDRLNRHRRLGGWFYRVTTNRCLDRMRRERVRRAAPLRWLFEWRESSVRNPEVLTMVQADLRRALDAVDTLPAKQRIAFYMYHVDGKELSGVGKTLGCSVGYACKLVKRAEARVRALGWEVDGE